MKHLKFRLTYPNYQGKFYKSVGKHLNRSLDEARTRYQLHEKKALTKPTGFYETKLETLTDIIISYERTQQEKSRRLHQLQQVRC